MRSRVLVVAVAALLAGCLAEPKGDGPAAPAIPAAPALAAYVAACTNGLLFQFVSYASTDEFLPPGFHPRDPQDFLGTAVAFGQAGVVVLALDCVSAEGVVHEVASTAIFVESPVVEGVEPALFDFYEVERYGNLGPFNEVLRPSGWLVLPGEVNFTFEPEPIPRDLDVVAAVVDDLGQVLRFMGPVNAEVPVGSGLVRFWRDGPAGLAYLEYDVVLDALVGVGVCEARPGTALARFAPTSVPVGSLHLRCPPSEPVVATFPGLTINATAAFLPGVHAA